MRGVFLCKFDEAKGFVPIDPVYIDDEAYANDRVLLKEIARNAIGFGSRLEYNFFSLKGVNCITQRFSIVKKDARGEKETFSLVIISDNGVRQFKVGLNTTVEQLIQDWKNVDHYLQKLFDAVKHPEQALLFKDEEKASIQSNSLPLYSHNSFKLQKKSRFAKQSSLGRNFIMAIGCSIVLITILLIFLYSQPFESFNFWQYSYTNVLMFVIGIFVYSAINKKKFLRNLEYFLVILLFLIPIYSILTGDIIFDTSHLWIFFTSFIAGLFVCTGLDNEGKIDNISLYILIFLILLVLLFVSVYILTTP